MRRQRIYASSTTISKCSCSSSRRRRSSFLPVSSSVPLPPLLVFASSSIVPLPPRRRAAGIPLPPRQRAARWRQRRHLIWILSSDCEPTWRSTWTYVLTWRDSRSTTVPVRQLLSTIFAI
ncbi:hypothetical protein BDA96_03G139300 [Sorghum bicolor]|uniref:Uncharacterized protein n=2 Tax=Sorghum bicolor TaxID=4558 RepID=A0A921RDU5_SORBI|nr:hypothetical protein BDA96_03G139300 [Sorghum bicolor]OQU86718.1 hypothetical protein SORBI_3003G133201 [Sorghum bicolor]